MTTYEVELVRVDGPLGSEEDVPAVRMPRARFLELVDEALDIAGVGSERGRDRLREVARGMQRFPFGTWVHGVRGCGCVIGEYVVALGGDREALAAAGIVPFDCGGDVDRAWDLAERVLVEKADYDWEAAEVLMAFGSEVDFAMWFEIDGSFSGARVVLIEDDEREDGSEA